MILNVFKTGICAVPFLPLFKAVFMVFLTAQRWLRHTGSSGVARVQNRRQKVVNRGALRSCRGALHSNLKKIPLIHSVSYFNLGWIGALFGGLSPPEPPRGDGTARILDYNLYRRRRACFVYLCHHPRSHFTKLLTLPLFWTLSVVTVHIFAFHVWPFGFMWQVSWIKPYRS